MERLGFFEHAGGIGEIRLSQPQRRNALSESLLDEFEQLLAQIHIRDDLRVVIVSAEGPVFSSGHDLREMPGRTAAEYTTLFARCTRVMLGLRRLPQIVVAQVQGLATAAGCQLVATSDLAVAASTATFATPGVKIGLFCSTPMVPLVRAIPAKAAMEMLVLGDAISASRALELGFVNRVVPLEELAGATLELAQQIARSSGATLRLGKRAYYRQLGLDEETAYEQTVSCMVENMGYADAQEGIRAFLEKRPPVWRGE